jgi:hypothetical protein
MHPVHDSIYSRTQVRGTLAYIGKDVKKTFPEFTHAEGSMGCVTVLEKSLRKDRQVPVTQKEHKNY